MRELETGPARIVRRLDAALRSHCIPVTRLGHFGSSVHVPTSLDIDVLLIVDDGWPGEPREYAEQMTQIAEKMRGTAHDVVVRDPAVPQELHATLGVVSQQVGVPFDFAFGPRSSPADHFPGPSVHLNGPVTEQMWAAFAAAFPLHAWVIRNNYLPLVGDLPPAGPIAASHVDAYLDTMRVRIETAAPRTVLHKLVQTLGLLAGEKSCLAHDSARAVFSSTDPMRIALTARAHTDAQQRLLCRVLLDMLSSHARVMQAFEIRYPEAWSRGTADG